MAKLTLPWDCPGTALTLPLRPDMHTELACNAEVCDATRYASRDSPESVQEIPQVGAQSHRGVHCIPEVQGTLELNAITQSFCTLDCLQVVQPMYP